MLNWGNYVECREAEVTGSGLAKYREDGAALKRLQKGSPESLSTAHVCDKTTQDQVKEQAGQQPQHTWLRKIHFPNSQE